jgi:hypothetical protein
MNDLSYQNDLPQEGERWVAKCTLCNLQTVKFLMLTLDSLVPKCSCDFKATSNITSPFLCM